MANFLTGVSDFLQLDKAPVIGHYFQSPEERKKAEDAKRAVEMYSNYRPAVAQARMNAMSARAQLFQPSADLITAMGGGRQAVNTTGVNDASAISPPGYSRPIPHGEDPWVMEVGGQPTFVPPGTKGAVPPDAYRQRKPEPGLFGAGEWREPGLPDTGWYLDDAQGNPVNVREGTPGAYTYGDNGERTTPYTEGTPVYVGRLKEGY